MAGNLVDYSGLIGDLTNINGGQSNQLASMYDNQSLASILPNILATAGAQQTATEQNSPQENQLLTSLFQQFGPQLAATGAQIGANTQQTQANTNASVAGSAGGQASLNAAIAADQATNPQFYQMRGQEANSLSNLLGSIDLSGQLSGGETQALQRSVAQQNNQTGTSNTPSAINTASNAMTFGNATYQRQEQAKSDLSSALGQATSFLPASQSGVGGMNAFNIATGGGQTATNDANAGLGLFAGPTNYSNLTDQSNQNNLSSILSSALGTGASMANTNLTSNNNILGDQMQATSSMIGSGSSMMG